MQLLCLTACAPSAAIICQSDCALLHGLSAFISMQSTYVMELSIPSHAVHSRPNVQLLDATFIAVQAIFHLERMSTTCQPSCIFLWLWLILLIDATKAAQAASIQPYRAAIFYAAGTGILATLLVAVSRLGQDRKILKRL